MLLILAPVHTNLHCLMFTSDCSAHKPTAQKMEYQNKSSFLLLWYNVRMVCVAHCYLRICRKENGRNQYSNRALVSVNDETCFNQCVVEPVAVFTHACKPVLVICFCFQMQTTRNFYIYRYNLAILCTVCYCYYRFVVLCLNKFASIWRKNAKKKNSVLHF